MQQRAFPRNPRRTALTRKGAPCVQDRAVVAVPLAHSFGFGSGAMAIFLAGGTLVIPSATPDAQLTREAVKSESATVVLLDRDVLKELQERQLDISAPSLRKGVLKIGSGWALNQEPEKFKEYSGTPLLTIGRGLPKRTSW
jgi:acyl-CoA synthetase (AMP-forming)/AMP-acid ligase II